MSIEDLKEGTSEVMTINSKDLTENEKGIRIAGHEFIVCQQVPNRRPKEIII